MYLHLLVLAEYSNKLMAVGVSTEVLVIKGAIHGFYSMSSE